MPKNTFLILLKILAILLAFVIFHAAVSALKYVAGVDPVEAKGLSWTVNLVVVTFAIAIWRAGVRPLDRLKVWAKGSVVGLFIGESFCFSPKRCYGGGRQLTFETATQEEIALLSVCSWAAVLSAFAVGVMVTEKGLDRAATSPLNN